MIDSTRARVRDTVQDGDLIFDTVGGEALEAAWPALKRGGTLVSIADQLDMEKAHEFGVHCTAPFFTHVSTELLNLFAHQIDNGQMKVVIAASFSLSEAAKAYR